VLVDRDLHPHGRAMRVAYSNVGTTGTGHVQQLGSAAFHEDGRVSSGPAAALPVIVKAGELQVVVAA
jgi:hypothetical protein